MVHEARQLDPHSMRSSTTNASIIAIKLTMDRSSKSRLLELPRELRFMIYYEYINTQNVVLEGCGYVHSCRTFEPKDRCCSCRTKICPHHGRRGDQNGSRCETSTKICMPKSMGLVATNRQIRKDFSPLYAYARDLTIEISHLTELVHNTITSSERDVLLRNATRIHVIVDVEKVLSGPPHVIETLLATCATQPGQDGSSSTNLAISYWIRPWDGKFSRYVRYSLPIYAGWNLVRRPKHLLLLGSPENPDDDSNHELLKFGANVHQTILAPCDGCIACTIAEQLEDVVRFNREEHLRTYSKSVIYHAILQFLLIIIITWLRLNSRA